MILILILWGCIEKRGDEKDNTKAEIVTINYAVVKVYPHDTTSFTEGLLFHNNQLFESTGSPEDLPFTRSVVGAVNLNTGTIDKKVELDRSKYFGEGISFYNNKLYYLTYITRVGFIYDESFNLAGQFTLPVKQGWGLTTDGKHLVMSDGTPRLTFFNPDSLKTVRTLTVNDRHGAITNLNELEYINGFIYANVYTTSEIVKIHPTSGEVVGRLDLSSLTKDAQLKNKNALELNGIAYDRVSHNIFVTGKLWPNIYELRFSH
ncbi:glutaminyl-peptide cyclotransferase [Chryseosolibacter indicus]|uniref:Glutaminyl-peptide cyclotransferase n=1 Tax=Chryseosolibacter indicus TaxID=2782351 RepID=A0ABS5VLR8_9BACT|nr:glutaminyl-peptide cyclotransferase [Chryseosolibacter indicus]MBT1702392.1 glutaminyl-peptide cyclotransferase [Chryseosolibacter indicus]